MPGSCASNEYNLAALQGIVGVLHPKMMSPTMLHFNWFKWTYTDFSITYVFCCIVFPCRTEEANATVEFMHGVVQKLHHLVILFFFTTTHNFIIHTIDFYPGIANIGE